MQIVNVSATLAVLMVGSIVVSGGKAPAAPMSMSAIEFAFQGKNHDLTIPVQARRVSIGMCLQGGEQVDISKFILPTASLIQIKVVLKPAGGTLIVYSPGYEDKEARFSEAESFATMPIAGSILCIKAIGGPFDFDVHVAAIEGVG